MKTASTHTARADRVLYYGLWLAIVVLSWYGDAHTMLIAMQETPWLSYDSTSCTILTDQVPASSNITQTLQPLYPDTAGPNLVLSRRAETFLGF